MKILITGATGFVGRKLVMKLAESGHEIVITTRSISKAKAMFNFPVDIYRWDAPFGDFPKEAINSIDAVINLMGENISNKRWSVDQKKKLENSRIIGTQKLVNALEEKGEKIELFLQASAIGYYSENKFLSKLCQEWEKSIDSLSVAKRKLISRTGVVFGSGGGALAKLIPIFKLGAGGPIGNGKMIMSWIHIDDLVGIFVQALSDPSYEGVINSVSPNPVSNSVLTKVLAKALSRPAFFPVPELMLKLIYGEMSSIMLESQDIPSDSNFNFKYSDINIAIDDVVKNKLSDKSGKKKRHSQYLAYQFVAYPIDEVFSFFDNPYNLEKITPAFIGFKLVSNTPTKVVEGEVIDYKLKIHGIPTKWKTLIKKYVPGKFFIDVQLKGPYQSWHHTHSFYSVPGGTLLKDEILYKTPLSILDPFIEKDIDKIFKFRKEVIAHEFTK